MFDSDLGREQKEFAAGPGSTLWPHGLEYLSVTEIGVAGGVDVSARHVTTLPRRRLTLLLTRMLESFVMVCPLSTYRHHLRTASREYASRVTRERIADRQDRLAQHSAVRERTLAFKPQEPDASWRCDEAIDRFNRLDELIGQYVEAVPPAHDGTEDTERFVHWLNTRADLDPELRDLAVCLHARRTVEFVAVQRRLAEARFDELCERSQPITQLPHQPGLKAHLNPVHVRATLMTKLLLDEETLVPALVLFYQVGRMVHTAVIDADARLLLDQLEQGPLDVSELLFGLDAEERGETLDILQHLADYRIIALV